MLNKYLQNLEKAEKLAGFSDKRELNKLPYKRFNQVWIMADKPLKEIYSQSLKHSELQLYPSTKYKAWGLWLLTRLKLKKSSHKLSKLLGINLKWSFIKSTYLPLRADVIYYRYHAIIMVYTSLNPRKVIKLALTKWGKVLMESEIESQRLASALKSKDVFIPAILKYCDKESIDFSVEEYFEGKRQSFEDKVFLETNYQKVFQFLLEFYLSNPIELQDLSESEFLGHDFVEEFIRKRDNGEEVLSIFKKLHSKKKRMILSRIHGDLNHNNILSNGEQVCIIDWGKSKHHYLARDLDNSSYNTKGVFKELIKRAEIDEELIYSYDEQLFLGRFIELNRLIYNGITRKTISKDLYIWTKSQNALLLKMSNGF